MMLKFEAEKNPSKWKKSIKMEKQIFPDDPMVVFWAVQGEGGKTLGHIWLTSSLILHAVHPRRGAADVYSSKNEPLTLQGRLI